MNEKESDKIRKKLKEKGIDLGDIDKITDKDLINVIGNDMGKKRLGNLATGIAKFFGLDLKKLFEDEE